MVGSGVVAGLLVAFFGAAWSLFMLVMMNGFSSREATTALVSYALLSLGMVVASGVGASALASRLAKGGPVGFGQGALATLVGAIAGSFTLAALSVLLLFYNPLL
jgi:hypothetical protein